MQVDIIADGRHQFFERQADYPYSHLSGLTDTAFDELSGGKSEVVRRNYARSHENSQVKFAFTIAAKQDCLVYAS